MMVMLPKIVSLRMEKNGQIQWNRVAVNDDLVAVNDDLAEVRWGAQES